MDFLETVAVFIPSLSGLAVTIYHGEPEVLARFEQQYCFSVSIQDAFTAKGMASFLEKMPGDFIYHMIDPLEMHLTVFKAKGRWVLLGPFVETEWDEKKAKRILAKHGAAAADLLPYKMYRCQFPILQQNYVFKMAFLILEHMNDNELREVRRVYTHKEQGNPRFELQEAYENFHVVNKRYHLESRFIEAISIGETKEALELADEMKKLSVGLRFFSENMKEQIAGAAIIRTLVRLGAKKAGMTPIAIDFISQEYAQKMQNTVSVKKLEGLMEQVIIHFCSVIREIHKSNYSTYVKKAIDYMNINLSRAISASELSEVAGVTQSYFVQIFGRETGMTVKQYLAKRRCDVASELLLDSKLSIQEIAAYVGYTDNNYFTKVFKAHLGVSPQDYRRSHCAYV